MLLKYSVPLSLLLLLLFIVGLGWGNYLLLERDALVLQETGQKILEAVKDDKWNDANKHLSTFKEDWNRVRDYWPMLIHHQEMDRIEESINRLKIHLQFKDSQECLSELYNLQYYIKHIPEKEALNLKNIF